MIDIEWLNKLNWCCYFIVYLPAWASDGIGPEDDCWEGSLAEGVWP